MNWKTLLDEVEQKGFENASPLARLAWSCETGNGVDQHAAPDIEDIMTEVEQLQKIETAAIALFQKCSELTIDSMDVLENELAAMSAALKGKTE